MHLYIGEEAVATGVIEHLTPEDAVVATYREHGQALARGVSPGAIMAEMYGKVEGCARGRGGSMHLFDARRRASTAAMPSSAAACRWPSGSRWRTRCRAATGVDRLLLRRGRGGRRRVPRVDEPGRAVAAAGAVRLREQSLRDGHARCAITESRHRHRQQGRGLRRGQRRGRRHGRAGGERGGRARPSRPCAKAGPTSWSAAPTASAPHSMFDAELYRRKDEVARVEEARSRSRRSSAQMKAAGVLTDADYADDRARGRDARSTRPSRSPRPAPGSRSPT